MYVYAIEAGISKAYWRFSFQKITGLIWTTTMPMPLHPWLLGASIQKTLVPTGLWFVLLLCPCHCTSGYLEFLFTGPWYLEVSDLECNALATAPLATWSSFLQDLGTYRSLIWTTTMPLTLHPWLLGSSF